MSGSSPETPAVTLRRAADDMRYRADSALCGGMSETPWRVGDAASCGCCEKVTDATGSLIAQVDDRQSAHVASWHPGVALAVAEWLELEAADAEVFPLRFPQALAVARAYLGTGPDHPVTASGGQDGSDKEEGTDERHGNS